MFDWGMVLSEWVDARGWRGPLTRDVDRSAYLRMYSEQLGVSGDVPVGPCDILRACDLDYGVELLLLGALRNRTP